MTLLQIKLEKELAASWVSLAARKRLHKLDARRPEQCRQRATTTTYRPYRLLLQAKKSPEIPCRGSGEFIRRQVSHIRKHPRYFRHVGRLVAFAAKTLRRQERSVRFNQNIL